MKKLLSINAVILLAALLTAVIPDYYDNPGYFSVVDTLRQFEWTVFTGIWTTGVLLAGILGLIRFKNVPYPLRF